jgi:hypothetical protein
VTPLCGLCGAALEEKNRWASHPDMGGCDLHGRCLPLEVWTRIAAPALAPEARAVLEAAEALKRHAGKTGERSPTEQLLHDVEGRSLGEALGIDVDRWIAAGRPGAGGGR